MATQKSRIDLHVHCTRFEKYSAEDIVKAMYSKEIDIIGIAGFNKDVFDDIRKEFDKLGKQDSFHVTNDSLAIKISYKNYKSRYILRIGEYENKEGFHLLVFGEQKGIEKGNPIKKNIERALSDNSFVVIDHPPVAPNYADITKEKEDSLFSLCKEYSGKIALEWNGYCLPKLRNGIDKLICSPLRLAKIKNIKFSDVNVKLENFEETLKENKINCPVIADTDLHPRNKQDLYLIGTANTEADILKESGRDLQQSLKEKVFNLEYEVKKDYVPIRHFIFSYAIPVAISQVIKGLKEKIRPRG